MKTTDKEKYLGDIVHTSGKVKHTIEDKKNKAIAISAEILAIDIIHCTYKQTHATSLCV